MMAKLVRQPSARLGGLWANTAGARVGYSTNGAQTRMQRWLAERPPLQKFSQAWWLDLAIKFTVFGVTGSSAVFFVRPLIKPIVGDGTMKDGPWSYRILSVLFVSPVYSVILLVVGTAVGRHHYFKQIVRRMWARFLPKFMFNNSAPKPRV